MDNEQEFAAQIVDVMMSYGKAQFGDAVKAYWVYTDDLCPCCLVRPIDAMLYKGKEALSINSFIYRERGVLIGYLLCGLCAQEVFKTSKKHQTRLHDNIEKNLIAAYLRYLVSLDA